MNIAVYLGSRNGNSDEYVAFAERTGKWIGANGHTLIYGGSRGGLMGILAESALKENGSVIGVLPAVDEIMTLKQPGLTQYLYTADVAERRSKMISLANAFIVLPGGLGTLDEISEVLSLKSLDLIRQPIIFFGPKAFFDPLRHLFRHLVNTGFSDEKYFENLLFTDDADEMARFITGIRPE